MSGVEEVMAETAEFTISSPIGSETRAAVTAAVSPGSVPGSAIGEPSTLFDEDIIEAAEAAAAASSGEAPRAPMVAEETTAVGAAERAAKVAAAKLAFDTAMADAAPTAPLDPFQQMMQSSIASLNTALAVLQATLAEARAENLALKTEVSKMKDGITRPCQCVFPSPREPLSY